MNYQSDFIGRIQELELLESLWLAPKAELLVLYGRRRVGKTRLLTHWIGRHEEKGEKAIYWVAEPTSASYQLRSFSQMIFNYRHPHQPAPPSFSYADWEQAFAEVAQIAQSERIALFIDEVTYLIESDNTFSGVLQKVWDHTLSKTNIFLALCGSQRSLMDKELLSYKAPLYGRATAQIELPALPFVAISEFFPNYTLEEQVTIYGIFGGVPAYLERLDASLSLEVNIHRSLFTPSTILREEPRLLLQDFITDLHNYSGILQAIAQSAHTQRDIVARTGLSQGHISKYLSVLRSSGFVKRHTPVTEASQKSRKGHYYLADPYLRFYYYFLTTSQARPLQKSQESASKIIQGLPTFLEENTWKELCQQWLSRHLNRVGALWSTKAHIPVAGIDEQTQTLFLGTALWRDTPATIDDLKNLISKSHILIPRRSNWKLHYLGFANRGWSADAVEFANELQGKNNKREIVGTTLLDLNQVYEEL